MAITHFTKPYPEIELQAANPKKTRKPKITFKPYNSRAFLTVPEVNGAAAIRISIESRKRGYGYYTFFINDCERRIELTGNLIDQEDRDNCIHKIDTLINELMEARCHLLAEFKKHKLDVKTFLEIEIEK